MNLQIARGIERLALPWAVAVAFGDWDPYCESPYGIGYESDCNKGCVRASDCAP